MMANDRLYIRCEKCNEWMFLAKHLEQGWYRTDEERIGDCFEAFLEYHFHCRLADGWATAVRLASEGNDEGGETKGKEVRYRPR